jgi:outer membrane immunogenic protein
LPPFRLEIAVKKIAAALLIVAMSAVSASAADLPARTYAKAPAMMAPIYNWTGFYVGLNAGGAWNESNPTTTTLFPVAGYFADSSVPAIALVGNQHVNRSGFTGGVTGGYNWQVSNAVIGIEADFNYFGVRGSATGTALYPCCAPSTFTVNSSVSTDWLATVRGRAGFFATPALLLYGTGGLAVANVKANYLFTDTFFTGANESASISTTRYGWTAGVGGEYALMNGWSIKAEYLYVDLGRASTTSNNLTVSAGTFAVPLQTFTHTVNLTSNIGRVGINYKFGGPVLARY